jgi:hypothetical protein
MDERNFTYMFYGFAAAWALVVLYVSTLVAREKKIGKDLESLRRMLEEKERKG